MICQFKLNEKVHENLKTFETHISFYLYGWFHYLKMGYTSIQEQFVDVEELNFRWPRWSQIELFVQGVQLNIVHNFNSYLYWIKLVNKNYLAVLADRTMRASLGWGGGRRLHCK